MAAGLICVMVVLLFCAFSVDLAFAALEHSRQTDLLNDAEAKVMDPSYAVVAKNSSAPGSVVCEQLVECLRDSGFDGEVDAYFYELPMTDEATGEGRRIYVYGARISATTPTVFARLAGVEIAPAMTQSWSWASPYSSGKTFTPATASNGILHVGAHQATGSWTPVSSASEESMPGVTDAIRKAKTEVNVRNRG